jgi:hypothetical protein
LDAAENIVKSRAEIRQVLIDHDQTQVSKLFGTGSSMRGNGTNNNMYRDLAPDGSSVVMQLEMHTDSALAAENDKAEPSGVGKESNKKGGGKGKKKGAKK